jgi:hypothetical protein
MASNNGILKQVAEKIEKIFKGISLKSKKEVCYQKGAAESQRLDELKKKCKYAYKILPNLRIIKVPNGCTGYYKMGCYSCNGKNKKCNDYFIMPK